MFNLNILSLVPIITLKYILFHFVGSEFGVLAFFNVYSAYRQVKMNHIIYCYCTVHIVCFQPWLLIVKYRKKLNLEYFRLTKIAPFFSFAKYGSLESSATRRISFCNTLLSPCYLSFFNIFLRVKDCFSKPNKRLFVTRSHIYQMLALRLR